MQWANFYLLPGGQGYLETYITSTSSNDAWGFKNIHFTGSQPFNIGDLWSPSCPNKTLILDPLVLIGVHILPIAGIMIWLIKFNSIIIAENIQIYLALIVQESQFFL